MRNAKASLSTSLQNPVPGLSEYFISELVEVHGKLEFTGSSVTIAKESQGASFFNLVTEIFCNA